MTKGLPLVLIAMGLMASVSVHAQPLDRSVDRGRDRALERDDIIPAWRPGGGRAAERGRFGDQPVTAPGRDSSVDFTRSVGQRPLAEGLQPLGIDTGAFTFRPFFSITQQYDSNLFGTETEESSDFITIVSPGLLIESDWTQHSLRFTARGDIGRHFSFSSENFEDFFIDVDGRLDILSGTSAFASVSYEQGHLGRSSPDSDSGSVEPRTYDRLTGYAGVARELGLISASLDTTIAWTDFDDGETLTGATINNDDDDNLVITPGFRLGYSAIPGNEIFVQSRFVQTQFSNPTEDGGPDRDNWGVDFIVGATKNFSDVWIGELSIGYAPRYFDDAALEAVDGVTGLVGEMSLLWNPTATTSVIGAVSRTVSATTTDGASAVSTVASRLTFEQEVTRQLLLDATFGYSHDDYVGASRVDNTYRVGAGLEYSLNRWVSLGADYGYLNRRSNEDDSSFERHSVGLGVTLRY